MPDKRMARTGEAVICGKAYRLISETGRGSASICYTAEGSNGKCIVKEFYPLGISHRNELGTVTANTGAQGRYEKRKTEFIKASGFQLKKLHGIQRNDFLQVIDYDSESGFIVMNDTDGQTLHDWAAEQQMSDGYIRKCIKIMNGIMDELAKYHNSGYVHLDLKAENIYKFNIENSQVLTRIFDFDSIQSIDALYEDIQNGLAHIHTTNECYGPEINDINAHRADYITKDMLVRLDYYAAARVFHYLLYGSYSKTIFDDDTPFDEKYHGCTVLNNYLNNMFNELFADISVRTADTKKMEEYFERIEFILDNADRWTEFSEDRLNKKFKGRLMTDIETDGCRYTRCRGITAIEQITAQFEDNLFLHGYDGGRGKTTAMKWLMFRQMSVPGPLYIYVPLNELIGGDIERQILDRYRIKSIPEDAVLLFDGYNEIEKENAKKSFDNYFEGLLKQQKNRLIVCGRNNDRLFENDKIKYCRIAGISEKEIRRIKTAMPYLNNEIRSNPMIADLYEGIDIKNIPETAKEKMIGKITENGIEISTTGEALYNYFWIQIYTKSDGDERAAEEFEEFLFELLPEIAEVGNSYNRIEKDSIELTKREARMFERCNKLFCLIEEAEDGCSDEDEDEYDDEDDEKAEIYYEFVHQNYYDFFKAINTVNKFKALVDNDEVGCGDVPSLEGMAADILGAHYCESLVNDDSIVVPKGYSDSYFGNGRAVIESDEVIAYYGNENLLLTALEQLRNDFDAEDINVRTVIDVLPSNNMNYSSLNIGWLLPIDDKFYEDMDGGNYFDIIDPDFERIFQEICFDYSYIRLPELCDKYILNCSFKHMDSRSFVPYRLKLWSDDEVIRTGNCIYTSGRETLLDYVGPKSGADEIVLFEETENIDEEFRKHCVNPDAVIVNKSDAFELRGKALYRQYGIYYDTFSASKGRKQYSLEFCERSIEDIEDFTDIDIRAVRSYACAGCRKLTYVNAEFDEDDTRIIGDFAFADCISLKKIEIPAASDYIGEGICRNCVLLEDCTIHIKDEIDLSIIEGCTASGNITIIPDYTDYGYGLRGGNSKRRYGCVVNMGSSDRWTRTNIVGKSIRTRNGIIGSSSQE